VESHVGVNNKSIIARSSDRRVFSFNKKAAFVGRQSDRLRQLHFNALSVVRLRDRLTSHNILQILSQNSAADNLIGFMVVCVSTVMLTSVR
jgi:hypothetical protein